MKTLRAEEPQAPHRWRGRCVGVPKAYLLGRNGMMSWGSAAAAQGLLRGRPEKTRGHEEEADRGMNWVKVKRRAWENNVGRGR